MIGIGLARIIVCIGLVIEPREWCAAAAQFIFLLNNRRENRCGNACLFRLLQCCIKLRLIQAGRLL